MVFRDGINKVPGLGLDKEGNTCKTCYGYGLWAIGDPAPMGPMDASDGMPTHPCPECGMNPNPIPVFEVPKVPQSGIIIPGTVEEALHRIRELEARLQELEEKIDG